MSVSIGLKDLHVAKLLTDKKGVGATYDTPVSLGRAISGTITPATNMAVLYADDGPAETGSSIGGIEVAFNIDDLTTEIQMLLLGNEKDTKGGVVSKTTDEAPYVAVGYEITRNDGKSHFVWLYKGMFQETEANHQTKGENVEFQTPTLTGRFIKRDFDDAWKYTFRSGDTGADAALAGNFFDEVVDPVVTAP
ncbi:major tail protein [Domibacillus aminovorans]|uniref:Phage tail protein n=1 Tax=Domibacillus aminovorans TaxID=29332 RepID=A0A177L5C5_9BACI|nr:major tail protein [Domibacillus aminovorans]OAH60753.1 hypothetical protein AWH49_15550 [Domibacillus aminovorans]